MGCPFFAPRLPHSRLLPKCQTLLTKVAICDIIMMEKYILVRGQTTRGGYLYAAAAGAQTTMRIKQQEAGAGYDTAAAGTRLPLNLPHAHAAGQYPSRLLTRLHPCRQTTNTYHPRLPYARMQQDERRGRRASTLRQP